MRCIKGEDGKVLVDEAEIKERWRSYFVRLFNGENEYPNEPRVRYRRDI